MKDHIDKIIENSLIKTEEFNNNLKSIDEKFNLNQVSLTGDDGEYKTSIYQIDGETIDRKANDAKNALTFIDIGARKKQNKNYNINENFNRLMTNNPGGIPSLKSVDKEHAPKKKVKGWKALVGGGQDHQFFNNKRLDELEAIEREREKYENNPEDYKDKDPPPEFTEELAKEMETLLSEGFA